MKFDNSQPIWRQLVAEFSRRIAVGQWAPGERIPGVRELAAEFDLNPNTVQHSLTELERTGLCQVQRRNGRFVTEDRVLVEQVRQNLAIGATENFINTAKGLGIERNEAAQLVNDHWEGNYA